MTTHDQLVQKLREEFLVEEENIRIHKAIRTFLDTQKGKNIDGWFLKRAKKYFLEKHGWTVSMQHSVVTLVYLIVFGGDTHRDYHNSHRFFLGHDTEMVNYDPERFEYHQASTGTAAIKRNENRQAVLSNYSWLSMISTCIDDFKKAKETLKNEMGQPGPGEVTYYIIRDLAGLEEKR